MKNVKKSIERFMKRKATTNVLGVNYVLTPIQYKRLETLLKTFSTLRECEGWTFTFANFIKYNVINYKSRYKRLIKHNNSVDKYANFLRYGKQAGNEKHQLVLKKLKSSLPNSREYWENRGYSGKDITDKIKQHQLFASKFSIEKLRGTSEHSCRSIKYWIKKGYSEDDAKKEVTRIQSRSLEYFITKYGNDEGLKRFNLRKEKYLLSYNDKTDEEMKIINLKKSITNPASYILKGYSEEEAIEKAKNQHEKLFGGFGNVVSESSQKFFIEVEKHLIDTGIVPDIYYHNKNEEYKMGGKRLDFYDKKSGVVIEYYGNYWHCNPYLYESDQIVYGSKTASERWGHDLKRIKSLYTEYPSEICEILIVWEYDVNKKFEDVLEYCVKKIRGYYE